MPLGQMIFYDTLGVPLWPIEQMTKEKYRIVPSHELTRT
jgi:hypothetical protein